MNVSSLSESCILVALHARYWRGHKKDQRAENTVAREYAMGDSRAGNYTKRLIRAADISPVLAQITRARTYLDGISLPWGDNGERIIPTSAYMAAVAELREIRRDFESAVDGFLTDYSDMRERAETRLGELFNPADFPTVARLRDKFSMDIESRPVAGDWRVNLADSTVAELRRETETRIQNQVTAATTALLERLREVVAKAAATLGDGDKKFRDSLLGNVRAVVDSLPALNIGNDARVESLIESMQRNLLVTTDADTVRDSAEVRTAAAMSARAVLDKLDRMLGKDGGDNG